MSETNKLQKNTIVLDVRVGLPGVTKKADMGQIEVDADKDSLRLTKEVLRSEHLDRARTAVYQAKKLIKAYALKSPFREGTYLLPVPALDVVYNSLEKAQGEFERMADKFSENYDAVVEDAKKRLGSQFNVRDYPPASVLRRRFYMSWELLSFDTPEENVLGKVLYKKELEKAQQRWQAAEGEVTLALREGLKDLIDHMLERLTPGADGAVKTFKNASVDAVKEFLDTFSKRNVLGDGELEAMVEKAQRVLRNRDAKEIRDSEDVRVVVANGLKKVAKELDGLVTSSKRKMNFED